MTIENKIKNIVMVYFKDKHKVDLWYRIDNPALDYISPKQAVHRGKGEWLLEECQKAIGK